MICVLFVIWISTSPCFWHLHTFTTDNLFGLIVESIKYSKFSRLSPNVNNATGLIVKGEFGDGFTNTRRSQHLLVASLSKQLTFGAFLVKTLVHGGLPCIYKTISKILFDQSEV